jgi:hypothetical protein
MLSKFTIAIALILAVALGALANIKQQHEANSGPYDSQGNYVGPGPDPRGSLPSRYQNPDVPGPRWDPAGNR